MEEKTTRSYAEDLHEGFIKYLNSRLSSGDVDPKELESIRKFLLDNNVTCIADNNKGMKNIMKKLPIDIPNDNKIRRIR